MMYEEEYVYRTLRNNCYPYHFIRRTAEKIYLPTPPTGPDREQSSITTTLPYIQGLSEPIRRVLQKLDVKVRFQPLRTLY